MTLQVANIGKLLITDVTLDQTVLGHTTAMIIAICLTQESASASITLVRMGVLFVVLRKFLYVCKSYMTNVALYKA